MMIHPIYQQWNDEAAKAISDVDPSAAPVVRSVRGFAIFGREAPLRAYLEDGSQWAIENGKARKLSDEEIADSLRTAQSFE